MTEKDIVESLRSRRGYLGALEGDLDMMDEAADEIERLRTRIEFLEDEARRPLPRFAPGRGSVG